MSPAARVRGTLRVPGDKSASHRALILGALASGTSAIYGLSSGADVAASARIVAQLGARVTAAADHVSVHGPAHGLHASDTPLDCENSGTTMRLIAGVVAGIPGAHTLVGDASLSRRPMDRIAQPLRLMGASVTGHGDDVRAPIAVVGTDAPRAIDYAVPVPSAQVKSAVLLCGLGAAGHTIVHEAVRTRTTTEEMLVHAGVTLHSVDDGAGRDVTLTPGRPLAREWRVPGDPSQAAFFCVLGAIHRDARVDVIDVDGAPERTGFVAVLQRMGATVRMEPTASGVTFSASSSTLAATEVHANEIPSVDEVPALTVAAAAATGVTVFRSVGELRVKESDRLEGSRELAQALGCRSWIEGDDLFVEGLGSAARFQGFELSAKLDHRMAMAAAVAATCGAGGVISGDDAVASSYPDFFADVASLT